MAVPGVFLARLLADCLCEQAERPSKILDIAGGHGLYGIEFAKSEIRAPKSLLWNGRKYSPLRELTQNVQARLIASMRYPAMP